MQDASLAYNNRSNNINHNDNNANNNTNANNSSSPRRVVNTSSGATHHDPSLAFQPPSGLSLASPSATSTTTSTSAAALKLRRTSMAYPSSPRVTPPWNFRDDTGVESHIVSTETASLVERKKGKMRRIVNDDAEEYYGGSADAPSEKKKVRKKWTEEETRMLVNGCNKHGVGNWKTILNDPDFEFDNRTPVDLKDRFRTYFPDAYKQHYPNAKTHLSSKVRAINPDGTALFEKTRSKKRRPFTAEEDEALKAGYERHGTVWAAIVKDPIFQAQNRRSTDLRDRFRNAFPDLYQAAGYKPRTPALSKKAREGKPPIRGAVDDQLVPSSTSTGPIRRRRANTSQSLLRGGTKSVPQSARASEDEASSDEDETMALPLTAAALPIASTSSSAAAASARETLPVPIKMDTPSSIPMDTMDTAPDLGSFSNDLDANASWTSGIHSQQSWSGATGSPTTSHPSSDIFSHSFRNMGSNIGKSAWTQDFLSPSPRLDSSSSVSNSGASSVFSLEDISSPFSFPHAHLNHNVMDRYDLFPTSYMHTDFGTISEFGMGDHHSTFSDDMMPAGAFSGFTHHSNTAGDLIFVARTHQPQGQFGFGIGSYGLGETTGLGLVGAGANGGNGGGGGGGGGAGGVQPNSINPMQLHTPSLPGIVEMEMAGMVLDDRSDRGGPSPEMLNHHLSQDHSSSLSSVLMSRGDSTAGEGKEEPMTISSQDFSTHGIEDILDLHNTPPATPHISRSRSMRRDAPATNHQQGMTTSLQGRSLSVPPTESRATPQLRGTQSHSVSPPTIGGPAGRQPSFYATATNANTKPSAHSNSLPSHSPFSSSILVDQAPSSQGLSHSSHNAFYHSSSPPATTATHTSSPSSFLGSPTGLFSMTPGTSDHYGLQFLDLSYPHGNTDTFTHSAHLNSHHHNHNHPHQQHQHQHQQQHSGHDSHGLPLIHTNIFGLDDAYTYRQGQDALDLASAVPIPTPSTAKPLERPPPPSAFKRYTSTPTPTTISTASSANTTGHVTGHGHQRGQSASSVAMMDMLQKADNKRKRASWDGGAP